MSDVRAIILDSAATLVLIVLVLVRHDDHRPIIASSRLQLARYLSLTN